jgi:hypothetical protein
LAEHLLVSGSGISSNAQPGSTGDGGPVMVTASGIEMRNGGEISSSTHALDARQGLIEG